MSATRYFVAECPLCRTKFETPQDGCPVCGNPTLRAIREAVEAAEAIPLPTRRTLPPKAARGRPAPAAEPRKAAGGGRKAAPSGGAGRARGPDGRFLPRRKGADAPVRRSRAPSPAGPRPPTPDVVRIDVRSAEARLAAAEAELATARKGYFAALRIRSVAEAKVRALRNEIRRARSAAGRAIRRKGALRSLVETAARLFGG